MKTKQSVKLIYSSPLWLIANGIRYSHNNHNKSDTDDAKKQYINNNIIENGDYNYNVAENIIGKKDFNLIKRIGFHMNHSSVLEHSLIVFDIKLTQKALLEFTRHRIGISYTVTSSRYALDSMGIEFEPNEDMSVDLVLKQLKENIEDIMFNKSKKDFDSIAELLPQAFIYSMQVSFNLRSLVHFLQLRINKSAHRDIRLIAKMIIDELPNDYKELVLLDDKIKKHYENFSN